MSTKTYQTTKYFLTGADVPRETKSYKPVSHGQLIDLTLESIHQAGFVLDTETYSSARDGKVANGRFAIRNVADKEMQLQIGWQNSYDKSLSLKFAIGTKIIVCSNGMVNGDYGAFKKKHEGDVQEFAPAKIVEYIKAAGDAFIKLQKEREAMKLIEIDKRITAELVGRMIIEQQFIESTQLNIIERELKHPTFDYNASGTLWELYQHTTFAMKEIHPSLWMGNHMQAHDFFVNASGELKSRLIQVEFEKSLPERRQLTIFDQLVETANVVE
jgi:hypothetical protein